MKRYDGEGDKQERGDILAWIKGEISKGKRSMSSRELLTHISSNLDVTWWLGLYTWLISFTDQPEATRPQSHYALFFIT